MSVIKSKRRISSMQFYKTARDLRRDITKMLEKMFSDESKIRRGMNEKDALNNNGGTA